MRLPAVLILTLNLFACETAEFSPAPGAPVLPGHTGEVRLLDGFPEEGSYVSVGIVIASDTGRTDKNELIEKLKKEAAKRGADAIVLQGDVKTRSRGGKTREQVLGAYALKLKP